MIDHLIQTTPFHHHPEKNDLSKTLVQIIIAAKWLVRHSITSPKQKRRPLPSLLSVSSSMPRNILDMILPLSDCSPGYLPLTEKSWATCFDCCQKICRRRLTTFNRRRRPAENSCYGYSAGSVFFCYTVYFLLLPFLYVYFIMFKELYRCVSDIHTKYSFNCSLN